MRAWRTGEKQPRPPPRRGLSFGFSLPLAGQRGGLASEETSVIEGILQEALLSLVKAVWFLFCARLFLFLTFSLFFFLKPYFALE